MIIIQKALQEFNVENPTVVSHHLDISSCDQEGGGGGERGIKSNDLKSEDFTSGLDQSFRSAPSETLWNTEGSRSERKEGKEGKGRRLLQMSKPINGQVKYG